MRLSFMGSLSLVAISLAVSLTFHDADASTRIFWNSNDEEVMLSARNMDLDEGDQPTIYAVPAGKSKTGGINDNPATWTSKYGSVVITLKGYANVCDEGINTQGLAFHYLYLKGSEYETRDSRPGVDGGIYGQYLLDNAANVTEALTLMSQTQLVPGWIGTFYPCHLALENAAGDSAVVEFVGGQMKVYHDPDKPAYILTNEPPLDQQRANLTLYKGFGGDLPWPGDVDSKSRFVRASAFLKTLNIDPYWFICPDRISRLFSAIRAEATPFGAIMFKDDGSEVYAWPTLWTSLFDLTNKAIYFTHSIARNNFWIDMGKLKLSPGAPVLYLKADRTDLFGDVSKLLRPPAQPALLLLLLSN
ncbi:MAG: linear amide C-N hydrolase [Deltaproteobacteria bacterium]|nr:linear amide C-N hydrolase [Deltaproteobacteria bacterium]